MPGMMDTVLNLGLNDRSVLTLAKTSGDERFAYDSYRRFIQMYSNVVLEVDSHNFEEIIEDYKDRKGFTLDTDLSAADWRDVIVDYKAKVRKRPASRSRRTRRISSGARSARSSAPG